MIMSVSYLSDKRQLTRVRRRNGGVALWERGRTTACLQMNQLESRDAAVK